MLKFFFTDDNFTIENPTYQNSNLQIIQRNIMFLGMTTEVTSNSDVKTLLQQRDIFQHIYKYNQNYTTPNEYMNHPNFLNNASGWKIIEIIHIYVLYIAKYANNLFSKDMNYSESLELLDSLKVS